MEIFNERKNDNILYNIRSRYKHRLASAPIYATEIEEKKNNEGSAYTKM